MQRKTWARCGLAAVVVPVEGFVAVQLEAPPKGPEEKSLQKMRRQNQNGAGAHALVQAAGATS